MQTPQTSDDGSENLMICFRCYIDDNDKVSLIMCCKCRSWFHPRCEQQNDSGFQKGAFICNDCQEISVFKRSHVNKFGFDQINKKKLHQALKIVISVISKEKCYKDFQKYFKILKENVENNRYTISAEFLRDCKQIQYQWKTLHKQSPDLVKKVQEEVDDLEQCVWCFSRYYEWVPWVKSACPRPHLLVWAKIDKVLSDNKHSIIIA